MASADPSQPAASAPADAQPPTTPPSETSTAQAQPTQSDSSHPEPQPHTTEQEPAPSTEPPQPQPELSHRSRAFLDLHTRALTAVLKQLSPPAFTSCFPLLSTLAPATLAALHTQLLQRLHTFATTDFEALLTRRGTLQALNTLERLLGEAKTRKDRALDDAPPPTPIAGRTAEELLLARLRSDLRVQRSALNAREQTVLGVNEKLMSEVRAQWEEMERLVEGVEAQVGDLEAAGGGMQGVLVS